jgi:osmotically-inducible protein OsmY
MKRQAEQFDTDRRDRETIAAVRHRIEHSRHKGLRRVKAKISDGTITLFGTVPTEDDRELSITLVGDVSHVERVIDEIEVIVPDARTS